MNIYFTKALILLLVIVFCSVLAASPTVAATTKRGEFPKCQEECLRKHGQHMEKLSEEYQKTGNKLQYQNEVEQEGLNYESCLTNCREPLPVK